MKKGDVPSGMTKDVFMSMRLSQAVIESGDYDLIVMGQPEGTGCYCAANTLLTNYLERLTDNYPYIVMDNEAGMEHISRLTTKNIDVLLIVSDPSRRGLQAAMRIHHLANNLNIGVKRSYLIVNQAKNGISADVSDMARENGLEFAGAVPEDDTVHEYDAAGRPTVSMPETSPSVEAAFDIFDKIIG
jgi:CO dehydrogenase maturation factor